MNNKDYHLDKAIGSSSVKEILLNVRKWRYGPAYSSKAMNIGSYIHSLVLEPELTSHEFVVTDSKISRKIKNRVNSGKEFDKVPAEFLTKSGAISTSKTCKNFFAENDIDNFLSEKEFVSYLFYKNNIGKIIITESEHLKALAAAEKINYKLGMTLSFAKTEQSYFTKIDGIDAKCRPDIIITDDENMTCEVIDLKTTGEPADEKHFTKAVMNYKYHIQQAWYTLVLEKLGYTVTDFTFLVGSTLEWSGVEQYRIPDDLIDVGKDACLLALRKLKYCQKNNIWQEGFFNEKSFSEITEIKAPLFLYDEFATWRE